MKNLTINTQSCMIMGIINATVDSFSGDGIYSNDKFDLDREIESMIQNGVDFVDVGGSLQDLKSFIVMWLKFLKMKN
ncbi:MAG: hypothetical protein Ct9H90mP2_12020 [Dehalococcoidia bacterium]|nr:MAG: hypothetical protein Ct9H90mP2_12020 [Dehalococcoidia bacterium]